MKSQSPRRALSIAAVLLWAVGAWACGGKVILDGEYIQGGEGGAGSTSSNASTGSSQTTTSGDPSTGSGSQCTDGTCVGLGTDTCDCVRTCGQSILEVKCAPNENKKLQCICSFSDVFSGACFETNAGLACNIDKGCCAKYFAGQ